MHYFSNNNRIAGANALYCHPDYQNTIFAINCDIRASTLDETIASDNCAIVRCRGYSTYDNRCQRQES